MKSLQSEVNQRIKEEDFEDVKEQFCFSIMKIEIEYMLDTIERLYEEKEVITKQELFMLDSGLFRCYANLKEIVIQLDIETEDNNNE